MHDPFLRSQTTICTWLKHAKQSYIVYRPDTDRSAVTDAAGVFYVNSEPHTVRMRCEK
jgi:hypothetical protein